MLLEKFIEEIDEEKKKKEIFFMYLTWGEYWMMKRCQNALQNNPWTK